VGSKELDDMIKQLEEVNQDMRQVKQLSHDWHAAPAPSQVLERNGATKQWGPLLRFVYMKVGFASHVTIFVYQLLPFLDHISAMICDNPAWFDNRHLFSRLEIDFQIQEVGSVCR
jgi:hypothetical protein